MCVQQSLHRLDGRFRRGFERGETDATARRIEHAKRRIVSADKRDRALQHERRHFTKIRSRIQRVRDRQQRPLRFSFAFLVGVETRVLISNRDLSGDRLQKRDFIVEPLARLACRVQTNQPQHIAAKHHRHDEQRTSAKTRGQEPHLLIETDGRDIVQANRLAEIDVF